MCGYLCGYLCELADQWRGPDQLQQVAGQPQALEVPEQVPEDDTMVLQELRLGQNRLALVLQQTLQLLPQDQWAEVGHRHLGGPAHRGGLEGKMWGGEGSVRLQGNQGRRKSRKWEWSGEKGWRGSTVMVLLFSEWLLLLSEPESSVRPLQWPPWWPGGLTAPSTSSSRVRLPRSSLRERGGGGGV